MINKQDPMLAAVVGYRLRHGEWPVRLRCGITPASLPIHEAIRARVTTLPSRDGTTWIAEGEGGRQFKFTDETLVLASVRSRGLLERWLGRPSRWLERQLNTRLDETAMSDRTCKRLAAAGMVTIMDVARRRFEAWDEPGFGRVLMLDVATVLYDRGLAFDMTLQQTSSGVEAKGAGVEPDQLFHTLDFEGIGKGGSAAPSSGGRRPTVLDALGALSVEHRSLADAALSTRPVLPGAAALEGLLHGSLAREARVAGMATGQLVGYVANRALAYHGIINGAPTSWNAEVEGALSWLNGLQCEAGLRFHGISGRPCDSYAELGQLLGAISESDAYGAVESFNAGVRRLHPILPVTCATVAVLRSLGSPVLVERWWRALPKRIRPAAPADLVTIGALGEWGWLKGVVVLPCMDTHVAGLDENTVRSYAVGIAAVFEDLKDWGAANVHTASSLSGLSVREVRAALERDQRWTRASNEWFVRGGQRDSVLASQARDLVRRGGCANGEAVHRVMVSDAAMREARAARKGWDVPPAGVLDLIIGAGTAAADRRAA